MFSHTWEIAKFVEIIGGQIVQNGQNPSISGISTDSRTIQPGECFFALQGDQHDGHAFVQDAIFKQANAVVIERDMPLATRAYVIRVPSAQSALEKLALDYRKKFIVTKIAVTGSMGKTTTKEFIAHILSSVYNVLRTPKSYNNNIGIPLTLLKLRPEHRFAVLEIGGNHLGEIEHLSRLVEPNMGVITCVAPTHLEGFGSLAGIEQAKSELLAGMETGILITNGDDPACRRIAQKAKGTVIFFGQQSGDLVATNVRSTPEGLLFTIDGFAFRVPIPGRHNVQNLLAAIAVAQYLGLSLAQIQDALSKATLPPMRLDIQTRNNITLINDAYNANPQAMIAALEFLQDYHGKRKIAILGSMFELGQETQYWHSWVGQQVPGKATILFAIGPETAGLAHAAMESGFPKEQIFHFTHPLDALDSLARMIQPGDVLLFKASRRIQLEELCKELIARLEAVIF